MVHYLNDAGITATAFGTYTLRSNIKIDATNYYTDKNVNSNEVAVPNVVQVGGRAGKTILIDIGILRYSLDSQRFISMSQYQSISSFYL